MKEFQAFLYYILPPSYSRLSKTNYKLLKRKEKRPNLLNSKKKSILPNEETTVLIFFFLKKNRILGKIKPKLILNTCLNSFKEVKSNIINYF